MPGSGIETRNSKRVPSKTATSALQPVNTTMAGDEILSPSVSSQVTLTCNKESSDVLTILVSINAKIDSLKEDFQRQLQDLRSEIKIDVHENLINTLEAKVFSEVSALRSTVNSLEKRVDILERERFIADIVLNGIPHSTDENLQSIFSKLCSAINVASPTIKDIFRAKPLSTKNLDTSIIIKCISVRDKNNILRAYLMKQKKAGTPLTLRDVGFDSNTRIFLHESLTKVNYAIFRKALLLRRRKLFTSVFTIDGRIYVRKGNEQSALLITNISELDEISNKE